MLLGASARRSICLSKTPCSVINPSLSFKEWTGSIYQPAAQLCWCRDLAGEEQAYIRKHAAVFTPSTRMERIPGVLSGYMDPCGVAVIEGGAEMDEFSKAALFSLLANVLYADTVVLRRESLAGKKFPIMDIFFHLSCYFCFSANSTPSNPAKWASWVQSMAWKVRAVA